MNIFETLHGESLIDDVKRRLRGEHDGVRSLRDALAQAAAEAPAIIEDDQLDRSMPGVLEFCRNGTVSLSTIHRPGVAASDDGIAVTATQMLEWRSPWRRVDEALAHPPLHATVGGSIAALLAQAAVVELPCETTREAAAVAAVMRIGAATGAWRVSTEQTLVPWCIAESEMAAFAWLLQKLASHVRSSAPLVADAGALAHHRADLMEAAGVAADDTATVRGLGTLLEAMAFAGFEAIIADHEGEEWLFYVNGDFDPDDQYNTSTDGDDMVGPCIHPGDILELIDDLENHTACVPDMEPMTLINKDGCLSWRRAVDGSVSHEIDPVVLVEVLSRPSLTAAYAALLPALLVPIAQ